MCKKHFIFLVNYKISRNKTQQFLYLIFLSFKDMSMAGKVIQETENLLFL